MTKRPLCLGAAGVLSGILAAAYGWSVFARALLACGVLACGILGGIFADGYRPGDGISTAERKRTAFGAGVFLLMFALGSGRYLEAEESRQAYLGELQDGMYVTVQGQLAGKQIQKNRYVYELTSCMFRTDSSNFLQTEPVSCGGVLIYSDSDDCSIGDILIYHGEITLWKRASNEGAFDAKAYYFARGFDFAMEGPALDRKVCAKRQTAEALWQLGQRIKEVYLKTMGERDAGILATMVVGDREFLDAETKRLYQIGGLSHILAISGLHLSFAGLGVYRIARRMTGSYKAGGITGGILLCLYVMMIGMTVSVIRAWVMFVFRIGADITGRHYDMPTALAASAVLTVGIHPLYLYDGGFWLSFGAVFAVCTVIPVLENEMRCKSLCAGLGINVLLWPVILYNFFEIPVYSILLNLIILPLMSVVLTCGMIGSFIKMAGWIPGKWILWICRCILWVYDKCCVFTIKLPMARWVAGRPDKRRIFIYYLVLMTVILILKFKRNGKKYIISITLYTVGFLILISGPWVRTGAEVTMLDVGQGDCICVEGPEHKTYLIDGGSSDIKNVGKYRIEPFLKYRGIGSIDYVFVSHGDIDHMNGIEEMLKRQQVGIKIRNLVVTGEAYRDEKLEELISVAEDNGTTVWEMENGTQIREGKLRFTCLGPKEKNLSL